MGADLAGAPGHSRLRGLVLSRQAALAASTKRQLSALADRCRAMGFVFAAAGRDRDSVFFWLRRQSGGAGSRACFFAFAYFIVALLPILGLIDTYIFQFSLVFDHFQYLASIGPLALTATALVRLSDFIIPRKPWLESALGAGLVLILGMASWQRTWVFESENTLWSDTLAESPDSWTAHNNLGNALLRNL